MAYNGKILKRIYDRTSGRCHICHKKLSYVNYADTDAKGAWEVEHSVGRAKGGTDHLNNLFAACISCNRQKGILTTKTARSWFGNTRAPLSKEKKSRIKRENAVAGGLLVGIAGLAISPAAAILGAALGLLVGSSLTSKK